MQAPFACSFPGWRHGSQAQQGEDLRVEGGRQGPYQATTLSDDLGRGGQGAEPGSAVEIEGEKQQQPESVEEIDIDLEDPEVGMAALKIQAKFRKKSKSPSPAKAKLLSENNLEIGQQQEITPIRGMPEMPTQIQMTSSQDIVS